ncbi:c-type cytochrome [Alishewanella sp. 16-MA]|uniref:C-type cytochrome n=1 Tax=Alishewanella maricola TaxID=2795740 RepID=A0ABS8C221_9ALTE|nr:MULTISPECIES: c-type cytochrome [Alishewanella]MDP4945899.1 c-type cytochrome [Alishewanella sp.]MDP5206847.1 c-type cytochrome [Alishewanella sp. SMS9]MCB5226359.1 c-type cytochrome [Alishewanella maricola]MDP5035267.1 c-type cytochrome [Alishewanella sp.]MDP5186523.1 c-type cytochrome [Alishewanella sp.]
MRKAMFIFAAMLLVACDNNMTQPPAPSRDYTPAEQQTLAAGSARARTCAACHGPRGISRNAMYPHLAGRSANELSAALTAYRDGERKHAIMSPQARGLTDDDITLLSKYFALLPAAATATTAE